MAYNLLGLRTRVRTKLGDSGYDATAIDDAINDTQYEIAGLFNFKFLEKSVEGSLTIGEYTYEQQDDHQQTWGLVLVDASDVTKYWDITNNYMNKKDFMRDFPVPDAFNDSQPVFWTEYGDQLYFNCPADAAYKIRQFYYRIPTELSGDSDVPDFPPEFREALILGATYRLQADADNYDFSQLTQNRFNERVEDLITRYASRQMVDAEYTIVGKKSDRGPWSK